MSVSPVDDPLLDARLRDVSARFFVALKGASFGRCDIRVDASGAPFMLEINPNCGVYYLPADYGSADLCLAHDPEGHGGFTPARPCDVTARARSVSRDTSAPCAAANVPRWRRAGRRRR